LPDAEVAEPEAEATRDATELATELEADAAELATEEARDWALDRAEVTEEPAEPVAVAACEARLDWTEFRELICEETPEAMDWPTLPAPLAMLLMAEPMLLATSWAATEAARARMTVEYFILMVEGWG